MEKPKRIALVVAVAARSAAHSVAHSHVFLDGIHRHRGNLEGGGEAHSPCQVVRVVCAEARQWRSEHQVEQVTTEKILRQKTNYPNVLAAWTKVLPVAALEPGGPAPAAAPVVD